MNLFKTTMLMTLMTLLLVGIGSFFGRAGMLIALGIAVALNFGSYWFSDKVVLAMYRAQEVTRNDAPRLVSIVEDLCSRAGVPMPKVCVIPTDAPNAFATGRNPRHAAVAVTSGILQTLDERELRGVIAHELAHVQHYDILTGAVVASMAGAIMFASTMMRWGALLGGIGGDDDSNPLALLALAIVAPIAAVLIQMGISRSREYAADKRAAEVTGDPHALANALRKLERYNKVRPMPAGNATAHMFIVNPLSGKSLASLFSTHPPMDERIARLERMAR